VKERLNIQSENAFVEGAKRASRLSSCRDKLDIALNKLSSQRRRLLIMNELPKPATGGIFSYQS